MGERWECMHMGTGITDLWSNRSGFSLLALSLWPELASLTLHGKKNEPLNNSSVSPSFSRNRCFLRVTENCWCVHVLDVRHDFDSLMLCCTDMSQRLYNESVLPFFGTLLTRQIYIVIRRYLCWIYLQVDCDVWQGEVCFYLLKKTPDKHLHQTFCVESFTGKRNIWLCSGIPSFLLHVKWLRRANRWGCGITQYAPRLIADAQNQVGHNH